MKTTTVSKAMNVLRMSVTCMIVSGLVACGSAGNDKSNSKAVETAEVKCSAPRGSSQEQHATNGSVSANCYVLENGSSFADASYQDGQGGTVIDAAWQIDGQEHKETVWSDNNGGIDNPDAVMSNVCKTKTVTATDKNGRTWGYEDGKSCKVL